MTYGVGMRRSAVSLAAAAGVWVAAESAGAAPEPVTSASAAMRVAALPADQREAYFPVSRREGDKTIFEMNVGTVRESHPASVIAPQGRAAAQMPAVRRGDSLFLTLIIPDDYEGHTYDFALRANGRVFHRRSGSTRGFGRRTFFIPPPASLVAADGPTTLTIVNRGGEPLRVGELSVLRDFQEHLSSNADSDTFTLGLLVNDLDSASKLDFVEGLPDAPGVEKAVSIEYYYMVRSEEQLRRQAETAAAVCERLDVKFLPVVCSWWAGTPAEVKADLNLQQICWSETDNFDEGPELRKLLGPVWDIRYGLSIPNKWSSTPWPTMNSPRLNGERRARGMKAIQIVEETLKDRLAGYVAENEPAYWAFEGSDEKYPVRREGLAADFNPQTVADARLDGVALDPSDGLGIVERCWLHYNVARYNQKTTDWMREAGASARVYSHALLDYAHFPLQGTGHARPYAEVARVRDARTGVEIIWKTDMDALWRVREWGPWGCVNREEWDGYPLGYHQATLRASYMMGGDMVNSYNWTSMGREGDPAQYFGEFLRDLGERDGRFIVGERSSGNEWLPVKRWEAGLETDRANPWANALELTLRAQPGAPPLAVRLSDGRDGPTVAYALLSPEDVSSSGPAAIRFGDLARLEQDHDLHLWLEPQGAGWEMLGSYWGPNYRVICELKEERQRSRYAIDRPAAVESEPLTLTVR